MDQNKIDDCMRRVRAARNVGLSLQATTEGLEGFFTPEEIFLAWHAACILDSKPIGFRDTDPDVTAKHQIVKNP